MSTRSSVRRLALAALPRPGLARCVLDSSVEQQRKLDAKAATSDRIVALWPSLSWRKRAEKLRVDESTLRGQLDPRAMNREPSPRVLELLEWHEQIASLSAKIGVAG